ncbi:MAG: D-arabinono-1,4-lactone oxidase [Flavisolibacter sp.]
MIAPDSRNIYHPETESDIVELVQHATANSLQVRVRGAAQSVDAAIFTDDVSAGKNINIMLNRMRQVMVTPGSHVVRVQAGCNLGFDPFEPVDEGAPNDRSTETNGLFYLLQQNGLAIANVTDAIHQTVGGFLSTGSAAGSTMHSFYDAVLSIKLVDGTGAVKVFNRPTPENGDDPFYGVALSLGLMGIITEVTLQCVPTFNIIGQQVITADTEAEYDLFGNGNGKPSLQQYLGTTEFCRSIWWPFPTVRRIISWKARTMQPSDYDSQTGTPQDFHPKPYQDAFYPSFLPVDLSDGTLKTVVETTTELVASTIYGLLGSWPKPLYDLCGNDIVIGNKTYATKDLQLLLEGMWPFVLPKLLNFFAPVGPPQVFWDRWTGLANDTNEYSNNLLPAYRTEFWIPTSHSQDAMQLLENFYKNDFYKNANNQNRNFANGSYVVEILGAKQTPLWLSPSFGEDCLRINFYSLHQNDEDVYAYFGQFWKLFAVSKIPYRLHWGYYLPQAGSSAPDQEISAVFPKFNAFAELRKTLDPENIFLTAYWKQHLNL